MSTGATNTTFARTLVDEFIRAGVTHAVISPGSRSAPIALALAEREQITLHVHIDERSAAFLALGISKATRKPAIVACTSGTAAVNFHPAVVEAHHARVPLIVLTADRPPELRGTGATQTIDQTNLYGTAVREFVEPGPPEHVDEPLWRSIASRAFAATLGTPAGPVHMNLAFREPLVDPLAPQPSQGRANNEPWHRVERDLRPFADDTAAQIADMIATTERGLVVAGDHDTDPNAVQAFADAAGWPLIADPSLRTPGSISTADALLRHQPFAGNHKPDLVVRFGRLGTSKVLLQHIAGTRQILIDPEAAWLDPDRNAAIAIDADVTHACSTLTKHLPQREATHWRREWIDADATTRTAINTVLDAHPMPSEPRTARDLAEMLPPGSMLVVSSSMPLRDLDWFMEPRPNLRILSNRGVNGIDGFVSTALGIASVNDGLTVALCGDLSMIHDANGLRGPNAKTIFVVVNNDGGGIFSFLPYADMDVDFERLFATPHGTNFETFAQLHAAGYALVEHPDDLLRRVIEARALGGVRIVEVKTDRASNVDLHRQVWSAVAEALS